MSEQDLNDPNVDPALQKMRREAMPQHMHAHMLVEFRRSCRRSTGGMQHARLNRRVSRPTGKQERPRPRQAPSSGISSESSPSPGKAREMVDLWNQEPTSWWIIVEGQDDGPGDLGSAEELESMVEARERARGAAEQLAAFPSKGRVASGGASAVHSTVS